ncbi:MAG: ABC transporter permease [Gemmatimonadales bacterium]
MNSDTPLIVSTAGRAGRRWWTTDPASLSAAALLVTIAAGCFIVPLMIPMDPLAMPEIVKLINLPPSIDHFMGTDQSSRDVLSRLLYGGRISLSIAVFATLVSVTLGTAYGAAAGYSTGILRSLLDRVLDALLSIPRLLILIAIFAAWPDASVKRFVLILGVTGWYGVARLVRGQVLALKTRDFVMSARAMGATPSRIFFRHILPNSLTPVVVAATLGIGHVIVLEAGLSYLGVGLDPPAPTWGGMIQDGAASIRNVWWLSLFPGLAIVLTVMAFTILGDALLRALEPRQKQRDD